LNAATLQGGDGRRQPGRAESTTAKPILANVLLADGRLDGD
jgi:hypothetical protein